MEGEGVARICQEMLQNNYVIHKVSHDNDASSMAQIHAVFPQCIE
jgi:hypothetical protein